MPPIGLLDALLEAPGDDLPWLVLADWLEEHGDSERAELIRLQCERERLPPASSSSRDRELGWRQEELLAANAHRWAPPLPGVHWHAFHRGLPRGVRFTSYEAYLRHAEAVWRCVFVPDVCFAQLPASRVGPLLRAPSIDRLTTLNFRGNRIREAGAKALAAEPALAGVRRLVLAGNQIGDRGVKALTASPYTTALRVLDLSACKVWAEGLRTLAEWPGLARLRELRLDRNRMREHLAVLACSPSLAGLEKLSLRNVEMSDSSTTALLDSPYLEGLRELDLEHSHISFGLAEPLQQRFGERLRGPGHSH
jgi:uncharacterized protein (TIGR02996 family)